MGGEADPRVVSVITEVAALDRPFDYVVPADFSGPLAVGSRVRVPLHGRSVRGWVVGDGGDHLEPKALARSLGIGPPDQVVELCQWAAWRWSSTPARFLTTASPERIVTQLPPRPTIRQRVAPDSSLGRLGVDAAARQTATVVELGPATDPLDLLLGAIASLSAQISTGRGVLVIVPGVAYARRLSARLGRRGVAAVDLAGGWDAARAGWPVVVGTRTAALAPLPGVAGIVVLDADDDRLRSEGAPTWSAVDVAIERGRRATAPVILTSSCMTPSLAALPHRLVPGPAEIAGGWPRIEVADRRGADPRSGRFSEEMVRAARQALSDQPEGVAVACILNRTGRARLLACRTCAALIRCERCDAAVARVDDELVCARCHMVRPVVCAGCGATAMKVLRAGTAQVAEEVARLLGVPVGELIAASDDLDLAKVRCVVGTEAVVHRLRRTRLVVFLDLDAHLLAPRAGAELETLRLIGMAARLVGGRSDPLSGSVVLQTRVATHPVVLAALRGDSEAVVAEDLEIRRLLDLPPVRACAVLRGEGASELGGSLEQLGLDVRPLGNERVAVLAPDTAALCDALALAGRPKARVTVAVDHEPE